MPTQRLIPDQFKWCSAAAANVAFVVSVIVDIVLYPAVVLHRAPVQAFGYVQVSVVDVWKVRVLPFSVVVDEGWNGKCSRNEMSLYLLPTKLYVGRGCAYSWRTVIKQ